MTYSSISFTDPKINQLFICNVVPRMIFCSLFVIIATTVAAKFRFFGDINDVIGAFGCITIDFVLPMEFYYLTFKPSKHNLVFWVNTLIAIIVLAIGFFGAIPLI